MTSNRTLYLSARWTTFLFFYYFVVLVLGVGLAIFALLPDLWYAEQPSVLHLALMGSVGMASNGAAIFYIRKLYKLCFSPYLSLSNGPEQYIRRLGTIVYFVGRPLFSVGFSLLVVIGIRSGFMLTTNGPVELNTGFVYMSMFFSFFAGFLSGRFVKQLEQSGERFVKKVLESEDDK
jgi:hypothetical protein